MNNRIAEKISVRPAIDDDMLGIRKVQIETWRSAYRGILSDEFLAGINIENPPVRNSIPSEKLIRSRLTFVATSENEEIIGFSSGGISRNLEYGYEAELWAIYVRPEFQGYGIGRKLFNHISKEFFDYYKNMFVWTLEPNVSSHKFYESLGGTRLPFKKPLEFKDTNVMEICYGWTLSNKRQEQI